jgi:hypothetical protein
MLSGVPGAVLDMPSLLGFAALDSVGALLTRGNDSTICRNEFLLDSRNENLFAKSVFTENTR